MKCQQWQKQTDQVKDEEKDKGVAKTCTQGMRECEAEGDRPIGYHQIICMIIYATVTMLVVLIYLVHVITEKIFT